MRDDFSLDELAFLRRPDGEPIARTFRGQSWDPALDKVADAYNHDPDKTLRAIIRRADFRRDMARRREAENTFRQELDREHKHRPR